MATGDVYTDGAVRGKWRRIMRAGWGVVVLKQDGQKVAWRMHGVCPDVYPSVFRAELTAVLNVLRIAMPPLVVHVDNAEVVRGFQLGRDWCLAPDRDGGELWREVWERMGEMEGRVEVVKVKAHTAEEDVREGVITERDRFGNLHADAEARRGARLAESLAPVGVARGELLKAMRWLGWARRHAAVWRPDAEELEGERVVVRETEMGGAPRKGAGLRHLVWERGVAWKCRRCGRVADTDQKRRDLRSSRCQGSAVGRLLVRTCRDPEAVMRACVERKQDMAGKGWRPRKGGGEDEDGSRRDGEEEYEEEWGEEGASEGTASAGEGEVTWYPGEEERKEGGEEGGAAAGRAVAAARSSGSASADKAMIGRAARPEVRSSQAARWAGSQGADGGPAPPEEDSGPPSPKKARTGAPSASRALPALPGVAVGGTGPSVRKDDPWDEDPFGHVEDAMASQQWATGSLRSTVELGAMPDMGSTGLAPPAAEGDERRGQITDGPRAATETRRRVGTWRSPAGEEWSPKRRLQSRSGEPSPSKRRRAAAPPEEGTETDEGGRQGEAQEGDEGSEELSAELYDSLPDLPELPRAEAVALIRAHGKRILGPRARTSEIEREARRGVKRQRGQGSGLKPTSREQRIEASAEAEGRRGADAAMGEAECMMSDVEFQDDSGDAARVEAPACSGDARRGEGLPGTAANEGGVEAAEVAGVEAVGRATAGRATGGNPGGHGRPPHRPSAYGRRYTGNVGDPVDAADPRGHALRITGPVIYCDKCGRYATKRIGRALKNECGGQAKGIYVARLTRLRSGLHPITKAPLL